MRRKPSAITHQMQALKSSFPETSVQRMRCISMTGDFANKDVILGAA
jgi:predicted methyltransferase